MKKSYLFALSAGFALATYRNRPELFPDLRAYMPDPVKQYYDKWFPEKQKSYDNVNQTVQSYVQLKSQANKRILYSRLHKRSLAVHQLIVKSNSVQNNRNQPINQLGSASRRTATNNQSHPVLSSEENKNQSVPQLNNTSLIDSVKSESQSQASEGKLSKTELLYINFFNKYAKQLINSQLCSSVELISGPIFSKDTPFKEKKEGQQKKQSLDNVYVSHVKISSNGEYLTDRFYTIVVCKREGRINHLNAFSMRRSYASKTFKLTNYLTSLKKLQEQTGLIFNVDGQPLTLIDYKGINKDRLYAEFEAKQEK